MTERLYYKDSHLAEFDAAVLYCEKARNGYAVVLDRTGNTSSASIPLALCEALDEGRVKEGDLVLLVGFGAGMTAASAVLRWGPLPQPHIIRTGGRTAP